MVPDAGDETIVFKLMKSSSRETDHPWRFMTNHAHVLECIAADPTTRLRDIAASVDITERTAAQIVSDLERAGYLTKSRNGRRNHYEVHDELPLRHPRHRHHTVGDLIRFLDGPAAKRPSRSSKKPRGS
jgi:DNA-binding IscR family transcriptional regulator